MNTLDLLMFDCEKRSDSPVFMSHHWQDLFEQNSSCCVIFLIVFLDNSINGGNGLLSSPPRLFYGRKMCYLCSRGPWRPLWGSAFSVCWGGTGHASDANFSTDVIYLYIKISCLHIPGIFFLQAPFYPHLASISSTQSASVPSLYSLSFCLTVPSG